MSNSADDIYSDRDQSFRDKISTVDEKGKRIWIYPKKVFGTYFTYRNVVAWLLLAFLVSAPFIEIDGEPLLLLNIIDRHFVIFGMIFWPQDFYIFLLATITLIIFIILFTVIYGRLFCGWLCPQTIFMEGIFRRIEYLIEGDWKEQMALDRAPWDTKKIFKKTLKHIIFYAVSFGISNLFLIYIIGKEQWFDIISNNPSDHIVGLMIMFIFSGAFYGVYAFFREQVCTAVCPYGRLQGVLLDRNSIIVAYDYVRGEKRSKIHKGEDRVAEQKGDCIDCGHCVDVCPTGIDIRNGVQLECINCALCVDACNNIMKKVNMEPNLIRYASEENIATKTPFKFTKRMIGYTIVLSLLAGILVTLLVTRKDVETSILRTPGMLYQQQSNNRYSNLYNYKIINKTNKEIPLSFRLENMKGEIIMVGNPKPHVSPKSISEGALFVYLSQKDITKLKTKIKIGVYKGNEQIEEISTNFVGPMN